MLHRHFIQKVREKTGGQIYYGPFATLNIPEKLVNYLTIGEMLGTYELCLHNVFNRVIAKQPQHLMIIGANHGYYCAGLSYLIQPETIIAYEIDLNLADIAKEWWKVNQLSPIIMKGEANHKEFLSHNTPIDFILCDCEGAEDDLLNSALFKWQQRSIIVVELHDFYRPGLTQRIINRFKNTHELEIILDDFSEDQLNTQILKAVHPSFSLVKHKVVRFPHHRWIIKNNTKIFGAGKFLAMWPKNS
jgi:Fe-S-cluster formation regulator IscX/YfhJ